MIRKLSILFILIVTSITITSTPATALEICERTLSDGTVVEPHMANYDQGSYDPVVELGQTIFIVGIVSLFSLGVLGAIYSSIRNVFYSPSGDQDGGKYIKLRAKMLVIGLVIPVILIFGIFIVEFITSSHVACVVPLF